MDNSDDILAAARILEAGRLVAFPTETVYGLGGDAENPSAVAAIYALKNRPSGHPLIVHVAPGADVGYACEPVVRSVTEAGITPKAASISFFTCS